MSPERPVIVDPKQPFLDVAFFERCALAAKAVARLGSDVEPLGTGFLISRSLVLTAYQNLFDGHGRVYPELTAARVLFDFAAGVDGSSLAAIEREGDITGIVGEPEGHWAVLPLTRPAPRRFPILDLDPGVAIVPGESAHIIHHPEGQRKMVSLGNCNIAARGDATFSYTTSTVPGSSGAPVFNDRWELLGLHYKGDIDARLNHAVSVEHIYRGLRAQGVDFRADAALPTSGPPQLYISACSQDRDIVERLMAYLAPLCRAGKLSVWHQWRVAPGASVGEAVGQQLRAGASSSS